MSQRIKIRLPGQNVFEEVFPGSVSQATNLAECRYPMASKVWWVGQHQEVDEEYNKRAEEFEANYHRHNHDMPSGPVVAPEGIDVGGAVGSYANTVEGMGLIGGGIVLMLTFAFVVLTFPVLVGIGTLGASNSLYHRFNNNPKWYFSVLLCLSTFAGGFAGTVALQNEYAPVMTENQIQMVEHFTGKNGN